MNDTESEIEARVIEPQSVQPGPEDLLACAVAMRDGSLAPEFIRLARMWQADRARLASLEQDTLVLARLKSNLAAIEGDYQHNLTELMHAVMTAELRLRDSASELDDLRARLAYLEVEGAQLRSVQSGWPWRFAMALRGFALRHPWLARQLRRCVLLIWWTLRGQLLIHMRYAIAHRRRLRQPALTPAPDLPTVIRGEPEPVLPEIDDPWPPDQPLVSVIIPCFNYGRYLKEAVDSILNQTYRSLEVILVEGGSTELESRQLLLGLQRPGVRVLLQGDPNRVGANRNLGIRHARGRYVCCLDADDKLAATYVEKAVFLLERGGYDLVSSALLFFGNRTDLVPILRRPELSTMLEANHATTAAVFRRSFWEKAGGYQDSPSDQRSHVHEDWRLWVRLAALGARFINLPFDPMLHYRSHGPSLSKNAVPMDVQRELIRALNADVLAPAAVTKARQEAEAERHRVPLAHLCRGVRTAKGPSLLLALPFMILGGAERLLSALVGHLSAAGWRIVIVTTVFAGEEHGDTNPWFAAHTSEIYRLPGSLPEEHWAEFVEYLLLSRQIEVLWIAGSTFIYERLAKLRQSLPSLRVADLLFNASVHALSNRSFREWIDLTFVESNEMRQWLLKDGVSADRITLVYSGVDTRRLRPVAHSIAQRFAIAAAPDDIVVCFAGRWSEEKNPLGFIEIARRVEPALPVRFVMAGTGHLEPMVRKAVAEARFEPGRFHLVGRVEDVAPWLAMCDVLVLPSKLDGRPVVVMEAMALGVPVLASRVGALDEMIEEGRTGWLRDADDLDGFATVIERIARDRSLLEPMRAAARAHAEACFDEQAMQVAYETALRGLASR